MRRLLSLLAASAVAAAPALAQTHVVDFGTDSRGVKPNGYASPQSALVTFSAAPGGSLHLTDWGYQSVGNGLAVSGDDTNGLMMSFLAPMESMSLLFGNDDPGWLPAGGFGRLTLFMGALQVGQVDVVANRNDDGDQTIGFSGADFDRAFFQFRVSDGQAAELIEIVDDVTFTQAQVSSVPEPSTYLLLATGLGALGVVARRRRPLGA